MTSPDSSSSHGRAHLVGSLAFESAGEAMRAVAATGEAVDWIPDGETGQRGNWVRQHERRFREIDGLEEHAGGVQPRLVKGRLPWRATVPEYVLRAGAAPGDVAITTLGYAAAAKASYEVFARLQGNGTIAPSARF